MTTHSQTCQTTSGCVVGSGRCLFTCLTWCTGIWSSGTPCRLRTSRCTIGREGVSWACETSPVFFFVHGWDLWLCRTLRSSWLFHCKYQVIANIDRVWIIFKLWLWSLSKEKHLNTDVLLTHTGCKTHMKKILICLVFVIASALQCNNQKHKESSQERSQTFLSTKCSVSFGLHFTIWSFLVIVDLVDLQRSYSAVMLQH